MTNSIPTFTTNPPPDEIYFVTKKRFGQYLNMANCRSIKRHYLNYLFIVGKTPDCLLTNLDIWKVDEVSI